MAVATSTINLARTLFPWALPRTEQRTTYRDPDEWFIDYLTGGRNSVAGQRVNSTTALGISAYFACIRNISEDIAKTPLDIRVKRQRGRGSDALPDHPVSRLLNSEPNPEMSSVSFRETVTAHALGYHGGFAEIIRNAAGIPVALWPMDPSKVVVQRATDTNELQYRIQRGLNGGFTYLREEQVFRIHGLGLDGITGYIISQVAKESLGLALGAQKFSAAYFGNGAVSTGVLEVPQALTKEAFERLSESFAARHGGAENAHKPVILENGTKFSAMSVNPEQSQMIESMQFGVEDVARWFRVPPHKIQSLLRSTFSNIESQNIEYVQDCILSWVVRWEQEIQRKLLRGSGLYAKHNLSSLLRGDSPTRSASYRELWNIGALSQNDIRELEDHNPIPDGDVYYVPMNMVPSDIAAKGPQPPEPAPAPEPDTEPDTDNEADQGEEDEERVGRILEAFRPLFDAAFQRLARLEGDKARRRSKREGYHEWIERFYTEHHEYVAEELKEPITAAARALWAALFNDAPPAWTDTHIRAFCVSSASSYIVRAKVMAQNPEDINEESAGAAVGDALERLESFLLELVAMNKETTTKGH